MVAGAKAPTDVVERERAAMAAVNFMFVIAFVCFVVVSFVKKIKL